MSKKDQEKVSIIGAGRVGVALAYAIARHNIPFTGIFSRSHTSSEKAMKRIKSGKVFYQLSSLIQASRIILIAVNDEEIKNVVRDILKTARCRGKIFLHTSGLLSSAVLSPLAARGAAIGSMHPLLPIPPPKQRIPSLKGAFFALEGQEKALREAERIVHGIGAKSFKINSLLKSRYHLTACFLSNYIVALSDLMLDILPEKPFKKNEWLAFFSPLIEATARSLAQEGIPDALTGPISRGDLPTLKKHQNELKNLPRDVQNLHSILSRRAFRIALQQNNLSAKKKKKLLELLKSKIC